MNQEQEYRLNLLRQRAKQEPAENTQNAKENLGRQAEEISSQHVNFWAELEEKVGIYVVKHRP